MSKRISTYKHAEAARINRALKDLLHLQSLRNPPVTTSQTPKIKNAETNPSPTQPSTDQQSVPPAMAHFRTARPPLLSPPKPPLHRHAAASIFLAAIFALILFSAWALALATPLEYTRLDTMSSAQPATPTIAAVVNEFLLEQKSRLSSKRFAKYQQVLHLFQIYLDGYGPGESQETYDRIIDHGGSFCTWFGPDRIAAAYPEFLGYYLPRKLFGSLETKRAAGAVMKRFAQWLAGKNYISSATTAVERAAKASRQLPRAEDACRILERAAAASVSAPTSEEIEDHFTIVRVEKGKIWLEPTCHTTTTLGPIIVPVQASDILQPHWDIGGVLGKTIRGWRLIDVWNVTAC